MIMIIQTTLIISIIFIVIIIIKRSAVCLCELVKFGQWWILKIPLLVRTTLSHIIVFIMIMVIILIIIIIISIVITIRGGVVPRYHTSKNHFLGPFLQSSY